MSIFSPEGTGKHAYVSYMDSFVDADDPGASRERLQIYGCAEENIQVFNVNYRAVFAGYVTADNSSQIHILQDIGASTMLEICVTVPTTEPQLQDTVSEFVLNL